MNTNKRNSRDWVLNRSKRYPGKYYYFNMVTGESVWCFDQTKKQSSKNSNSTKQVKDIVLNCPEPVASPNETTITSSMFNPRNSSKNAPTQTFSTSIFPKYINEPHFQNVTRAPIPLLGPNTDRDLFSQTTIPLSQRKRFASFGNISSPSDYNYNYCKPVKEFHTSTPMKNLWNVTEQILDTDKCEQEKISQLQYKRKLVEPKLILKEAKVKNLPDKHTYNDRILLKANEDTEKRSLSQPNRVEYSENDKSNEDSLKRMVESNIRFVQQSKRLKSVDICYEKQEREKKRVTFNLQSYDDGGYSVPNNEETVSFKASIPIKLLKKLTKIPPNNQWYISVDENVLLEDFDFITDYVAKDNSCKLLIPDSTVTYIEELARGEHGGRNAVMLAKHVHRRLGNFRHVQVVETEDGASAVGDVIKCCMAKMDMGARVALITKIEELEKSAKSFGIHVYNLDYIKNGTKPSTENVCSERNSRNNLFLQSADDFDPFLLSKTVHTVNSLKNIAFHDSDSSLFDYDKDCLNHANQENTIIMCQAMEKLNLNDTVLSNIKRVIKNCNAKTKISDRNPDNSNINTPIRSIFDHIDNKNESININNNSIVNLTRSVHNNLYERENSNINEFTGIIRRDLKDDNLSKTNLTTTSISNDKYTNKGENIWKVQKEKHNLKKHEYSDIVEDKLRFEVKDETIENNIVLRLEEWICCFVQIMEELIKLVSQKNVDTKDLIPFSLRDGLIHLKDLYSSTEETKVIIEKLLALCRFCPMKGNLNKDIEANDFLKILGCGFLLLESLEGVLSEDSSEIKGLLETLVENIQTSHLHEDPEQVETSLHPSETDEGTQQAIRTNFMERRRDIVQYLKNHFVEWRIYDENVNEIPENRDLNQNVKIHRTFGRNLSSFRIDNEKRITLENPKEHSKKRIDKNTLNDKDGRKVIGNESLIVANKDKEKPNLDLDALDYSEIEETTAPKSEGFNETQNNLVNLTRSEIPKEHKPEIKNKVTNRKKTKKHSKKRIDKNTLNDKDGRKVIGNESLIVANKDKEKPNLNLDALDYSEIEETTAPKSEGFNETQNNLVNLTRSDKNDNNDERDSTADSGLENENYSTFIRHFLAEVTSTLIAIRTFLTKSATDFRDDKMTDETKKGILDKAKQLRIHLAAIVQELKAIIERDSRPDSALKSVLLKAGSGVAEDRRMTRYRQTVTKLLEQAQILESYLKIY